MGRPKKSGNDPLPPPVEASDCEMEESGLEEAADGDSPGRAGNRGPRKRPDFIDLTGDDDHPTAPCTPSKSSQSADPSTPDSGFVEGEDSSPDGSVQLSPPKTLVGAIGDICDEIRKPFSEFDRKGPGYAYVFYDPSDDGDMYKIGQSTDVPNRETVFKESCKIEGWQITSRPRFGAIWGHHRLEQLAHKQQGNSNCRFVCRCPKNPEHKEFFMGQKETALAVLDIWTKWLWQTPYDDNGQLEPYWENRLELLEPKYLAAFTCGKEDCPSKSETAPACPACLMEGWKVWTTATFADKVEYNGGLVAQSVWSGYISVRQAQFPWPMVLWRAILFFGLLYMSVFRAGYMYLVSCLLEGSIALAFYPYPQLRVQQVFSQSGKESQAQPGDTASVKQKRNTPKGKQPEAHFLSSSLRRTSRSMLRLRSTPSMDASPDSPSAAALRRKRRKPTKQHTRESCPPPSQIVQPQTPSNEEEDASRRSQADESARKQPRRSPRLATLAET